MTTKLSPIFLQILVFFLKKFNPIQIAYNLFLMLILNILELFFINRIQFLMNQLRYTFHLVLLKVILNSLLSQTTIIVRILKLNKWVVYSLHVKYFFFFTITFFIMIILVVIVIIMNHFDRISGLISFI